MGQYSETLKQDLTIAICVLEAVQGEPTTPDDLRELVGIALARLDPYTEQPIRTEWPSTTGKGRAEAGRILVVDDDDAVRDMVKDVLDVEGYSVAAACNGAEALQVIERECPSLVLLDMRMPVLDGWGVARELRKRGLQVPIVVMTAASDAGHWADEIAADGCLAKPFDLSDLLTIVERFR